jgi:hypothetical protein
LNDINFVFYSPSYNSNMVLLELEKQKLSGKEIIPIDSLDHPKVILYQIVGN